MTAYEFVQWYMAMTKKNNHIKTVGNAVQAYNNWKSVGSPMPMDTLGYS